MIPLVNIPARRAPLAQAPAPVNQKNGLEKTRDLAVVVATLTGAAVSFSYVGRRKTVLENVALGLTAAALGTVGTVTLVNDVLS